MNHYLDISLLPDPEFPAPMLMNALFTKLHRGLVQQGNKHIGVSFPQVDQKKIHMGNILRLHGEAQYLQQLQEQPWLKGMRDHIEQSDILPVPDHAQHYRVSRVHVKSSAARLRRRYLKRHPDVTKKQVEALIPDTVAKPLDLPYLQLNSDSTGQRFRLFVQHKPADTQAVAGEFNNYGLSFSATIPWF